MKTVKIGKHVIELFDNIEELPITRFHKYQKCLLIDSGIGGTIGDFDKHIEKARRYLMQGNCQMAEKELANMRQNVFMVQSGMNPKHMAFACLVNSIDGKPCSEISDDAIQKVVELLADMPNGDVNEQLDSVKKKIDAALMLYFPNAFNDGDVDIKDFFDKLRRRTLLVLQNIVAGVPVINTEEVEKLTTALITYSNPQTFDGSESVEIQFDRQFENLCLILSGQLNVNPKKYSVMEFYNAFEYLKEKAKSEAQATKTARNRK